MARVNRWVGTFLKAFIVAFAWLFLRRGFPTTVGGLIDVADTSFIVAASVTTGFYLYKWEKESEDDN